MAGKIPTPPALGKADPPKPGDPPDPKPDDPPALGKADPPKPGDPPDPKPDDPPAPEIPPKKDPESEIAGISESTAHALNENLKAFLKKTETIADKIIKPPADPIVPDPKPDDPPPAKKKGRVILHWPWWEPGDP